MYGWLAESSVVVLSYLRRNVWMVQRVSLSFLEVMYGGFAGSLCPRLNKKQCMDDSPGPSCPILFYAPINVMPAGGEAGHRVGI